MVEVRWQKPPEIRTQAMNIPSELKQLHRAPQAAGTMSRGSGPCGRARIDWRILPLSMRVATQDMYPRIVNALRDLAGPVALSDTGL